MKPKQTVLMTLAAGTGLAVVVLAHSPVTVNLGASTSSASGPSGSASSASSSANSSASSSSGGAKHHTAPTHSSHPGAATASPSASSGSASASTSAGTATGQSVNYGYGVLAVRVTISGGHITAVTVPVLQTADSYSQQIATQVFPMLKSEVLSAQSAKISTISGASYTSEAYAMSLQNALKKLHFS
ncbi:MAG: FMN-binding protein [Actinomycetota bacterium]|nr:FMN-binding protein [Actinomycetota bacterium]